MTVTWYAIESLHADRDRFELVDNGRVIGWLEVHKRHVPDPTGMLTALCQSPSAGAATREGADGPLPPVATPADGPSTLRQQRDIHITLAELGYRTRDQRLSTISVFLGREITSTKQLTHDEADRVLARAEEKRAARAGKVA